MLTMRYVSHFMVPFTLRSVIDIYLFSSHGKLPCTYIILASLLCSVIPISPTAKSISVVISSGSGDLFIGIPLTACSTYRCVIGDSTCATISGISPLSSLLSSPIYLYQRANIFSFSMMIFPSLFSMYVVELLPHLLPVFNLICKGTRVVFCTSSS